jgi:hypothetical protein
MYSKWRRHLCGLRTNSPLAITAANSKLLFYLWQNGKKQLENILDPFGTAHAL